MNARQGLANRTGLALLGVGLLLGGAVLAVPALAPWSALAPGIAAAGAFAYLATVAVIAWPSTPPTPPEVLAVRAVRETMARRLAEHGGTSSTTRILADALRTLDRQLLPKLVEATTRQRSLGVQLDRYDRHELPRPDPRTLYRLRAIHARQRQAIETLVQQVATADAALLALTQEVDESVAASQAQVWMDDLVATLDALTDALHGEAGTPTDVGQR